MPVWEQASMGSRDFKAYARRRKVKKEGLDEKTLIFQDQSVDCGGSRRGHCTSDDEPSNKLLSLELDVAEALAGMAYRPLMQPEFLRWSCKRKRTASLTKYSMSPSIQPKEEPEDALSTVKKNISSCAFGRDSSTSDRDEIESIQCSKDSSSLYESRAQSPSSPLPSMQLPCGNFLAHGSPDSKSAFQRVLPLAPCLLTIKTEIEEIKDIHSERLATGPPQVSVRRKAKACKSMGSKAAVKIEHVDEHGAACSEELGAIKLHKVAPTVSLNKPKSELSEKEKEARRLRRIQANRESARQTIRKKQVLCEDLTKKASNLASENEGMKQKRDALMQELFSLKGQNHHLKQQLERSSGNLGHDSVELPLKMSPDCASVPALQAPSLSYAGAPPPAFAWAMAAAAAAANQAYIFNNKEMWDASAALQQHKAAFMLPSVLSCKQAFVPEGVEQCMNHTCSGDSFLTIKESPQNERGLSMGVDRKSEEGHCDPLLRKGPHPAIEFASGDLSGKCDISMQDGCLPTAASKPEFNSGPGIAATSKSMECVRGAQVVQAAACGFTYSGSVAGYIKGNPHAHALVGRNYYVAMVAAEARKRRKELTRNKFSRSRAIRPAAVS